MRRFDICVCELVFSFFSFQIFFSNSLCCSLHSFTLLWKSLIPSQTIREISIFDWPKHLVSLFLFSQAHNKILYNKYNIRILSVIVVAVFSMISLLCEKWIFFTTNLHSQNICSTYRADVERLNFVLLSSCILYIARMFNPKRYKDV